MLVVCEPVVKVPDSVQNSVTFQSSDCEVGPASSGEREGLVPAALSPSGEAVRTRSRKWAFALALAKFPLVLFVYRFARVVPALRSSAGTRSRFRQGNTFSPKPRGALT